MFFVLSIKTKGEIYDKLANIWIWIKKLLDQKIKYICLNKDFRNNIFNV